MDDFSKSIAATTSSALSGEAQATAAKIQKAVTAGVVGDGALQARLSGLSARLQVFRLHADQLSRCIADAPVVHPNLGDVLKSSLAESAHALRTVTGRLEPGSDSLDSHAVSAFEALLAAYTRLFVLGTQLLTIETEQEQQAKLASPVAREIVAAAHNASQGVLSFSYAMEN